MQLESTRTRNLHKGPSSSKEFNSKVTSIQKDIASLFDVLNSNEMKIETNMDIVLREHHFFQKKLYELEMKVKELQDRYNLEGYKANEMRVLRSFYDTKRIKLNASMQQAYIDSNYGIATTFPTNITSKLSYQTDSGEVFLPQGLEVYARETNDTASLNGETKERVYQDVSSEGLASIVDRKKETYWIRNSTFKKEECVTKVFGEIHIKVPTQGLNNLYSNVLTITPYPLGSMTIEDVFYRGYGDQWARLQNFPTKLVNDIETPIPIENAENLFFSFEKTEITELRILFSQPYWFENNNERVFAYGFQGIDLQYHLYSEKDTQFVSELSTSNPSQNFQIIQMPEAIPADVSETDLTDLVEHHLYYDESLSTEFEFGSNIVAPLNKVYIKTILRKLGDKTPVIKQMVFPYTFKTNDIT